MFPLEKLAGASSKVTKQTKHLLIAVSALIQAAYIIKHEGLQPHFSDCLSQAHPSMCVLCQSE
jgi:hypothetical protein